MKKLRKMSLVALVGIVISGCAFFGIVDSTQGKLGEGQSVCNNLDKDTIFSDYYRNDGYFSNIGGIMGQSSIAGVENLLGAQVHYMEIKRDEKESVCAFVMATNTAYKQVKLTSQEIARLEKAVANSGKYRDYEKSSYNRGEYYTGLKFLKYHNKLSIPSDASGLESLQLLSRALWSIDNVESEGIKAQNIVILRFIHGEAQLDNSPYHNAFVYSMSSKRQTLGNLKGFLTMNAQNKNNCVRWGGNKGASESKCLGYVGEIRAIKSYAESLLD